MKWSFQSRPKYSLMHCISYNCYWDAGNGARWALRVTYINAFGVTGSTSVMWPRLKSLRTRATWRRSDGVNHDWLVGRRAGRRRVNDKSISWSINQSINLFVGCSQKLHSRQTLNWQDRQTARQTETRAYTISAHKNYSTAISCKNKSNNKAPLTPPLVLPPVELP